MPQAQKPWGRLTWLGLTIRADGDPTTLAPAIRDEILALDPAVLPELVATLDKPYAGPAYGAVGALLLRHQVLPEALVRLPQKVKT